MKIELTLENKAKFFAQYWGQEVFKLQGLDKTYKVPYLEILDEDHLLLKPLSSIIEENANELAKIINCHYSGITLKTEIHTKKQFGKDHTWCRVFYIHEDNQHIVYNIGDGGLSHNSGNAYFEQYAHASDFLRSKGYALPWMGLLVEEIIEAGWIKLKS